MHVVCVAYAEIFVTVLSVSNAFSCCTLLFLSIFLSFKFSGPLFTLVCMDLAIWKPERTSLACSKTVDGKLSLPTIWWEMPSF